MTQKFKLVPVEPTPEMLKAARNAPMPTVYLDSLSARADLSTNVMWRTMLEAAPDQTVQEPVAYLYHDARTPKDAHPWVHSTMLVLAADRRPQLRGETPLYITPPDTTALLEKERPARIAAQTENEALKAKLAASGVAERRKYHPLLKQALDALEAIDRDDNDRDFLTPAQCHQLAYATTAIRKHLGEA